MSGECLCVQIQQLFRIVFSCVKFSSILNRESSAETAMKNVSMGKRRKSFANSECLIEANMERIESVENVEEGTKKVVIKKTSGE